MPFSYDANNHVVAFNGGAAIGTTGTNYYFDGLEQRVKKADYYSSTVFVYDALGNLVAEYATDGQTGAGTSYITTDALGTPRVMTDASGGVRARHDYPPFGEEIGGPQVSLKGGRTSGQGYVSDGVRQKFTGKERDSESGLDYFLARDYQSGHGRFTSVDPLLASARITNPQTFNRYSYVANNPLRFTDPTGLVIQGDGGPAWEQDQEEKKKRKQEEQPFSGTGCEYGTEGCGNAFEYEVTVTAEPEPATTDTQVVTDLQVMTGVQQPFPSERAASIANSIFNGNGARLGLVGPMARRDPRVALVAGVIIGAILEGAMILDFLDEFSSDRNLPEPDNTPTELDGDLIVVRGGVEGLPPSGTVFSGAVGLTLEHAAAAVPHGTIRSTTVKAIVETGGSVVLKPELTRGGVLNLQHVNIVEGPVSTFSPPFKNPVPSKLRIK